MTALRPPLPVRLAAMKAEVLAEVRGVAHAAPIVLMEPELRGLSDDAVLDAWYEALCDLLLWKARNGTIACCRAMHVRDIDAFLDAVESGQPLGVHWTHDERCASTGYHDDEKYEHEVILYAEAPSAAIDWKRTLLQNFMHPREREITVTGDVRLTLVAWNVTDGHELDRVCPTAGEWRDWMPETAAPSL